MARRKDHTRDELKQMALDAATNIASEQGLAALTAREVARAIGYTVGTLYNVFKNFDDLILHVNARTLDQLEQVFLQTTASKAKDPWHTVQALAKAYIDFAHDHVACWRLLFEPRTTKQTLPDWYQTKADKLFNVMQEALVPLLDSTQRVHMAAKVIWSALYGLCALSLNETADPALRTSTHDLAQSLVKNYLTGLTNKSAVPA